jgi:hypothetical protein
MLLAACGGGGSSSNNGGGGGGGGGGGNQTIAAPGPPNVESLVVDAGPAGLPAPAVNTAFVSVEVCIPQSATCQTIDHVEVDTGSIGLRLLSSVVNTVTLPPLTAGGDQLAECLQFADNTEVYGALATADVVMPVSGEKASGVIVQLIGAASAGNPPAACTGTANNTVALFGANGILGVGPFINDCNTNGTCAPGTQSANYYSCPTPSSCSAFTASLAQQLPNPVILLPKDNNGVIFELPAVAAAGVTSVSGSLVFGIGTETNNALGSAAQLLADANSGEINASLNGTAYPNSYLDSGSNANFLNSSLPTCAANTAGANFLCPAATTDENATLEGTTGVMAAADFQVANADTLFNANPNATAFNSLGAPAFGATTLDLGLAFFYGRNVYTSIEDPNLGSTPYFAYASN